MEQEERKISKFSSGLNILMRIDALWKDTHKHSREGKYSNWNDDLDRIWVELARDLKPNEYYDLDSEGKIITDSEKEKKKIKKEGYITQFKKFDEKLKDLMPFQDLGMVGFQQPTEDMKKKRSQQYSILMEKQLFLARLENELGKGTSWEDEDEDF